jgi:hypothetical protein
MLGWPVDIVDIGGIQLWDIVDVTNMYISGWWLSHPSGKYESQLG